MVERMEHDTVQYSHEFGASINFCDRREEGGCPFSDRSQCWCDELDACARHDLEIWENAHDMDCYTPREPSPLEELRHWLDEDLADLAPWDVDETRERWRLFTADDDLAWLYFYDPRRLTDDDPDPEPGPEDFEDFHWDEPF